MPETDLVGLYIFIWFLQRRKYNVFMVFSSV
jgi:hypothetical protein